ncbi:AN1-type zinc finger protein 2B-like isoform X2 [Polyodon spathula]|uniref:AN1-type zinc finger protein 2B-like isoform X2 n=1 Tax=Polyodon spathula TaxID=7913 RepID=UPI001B7F6CA5|nr:AN1-type zinc finger protein 2B-like isoform X2 [Polyodon spathula]
MRCLCRHFLQRSHHLRKPQMHVCVQKEIPLLPQDVQVPVCPLCNTPIPVSRGEMPDIKVGEHIDGDCKSDPARRKRKIFTNKCSKGGCKQKEMIKVTCDQCHLNFCLKHRHPLDHECKANGHAVSKSGHAALMQSHGATLSAAALSSKGTFRSVPHGLSGNERSQPSSTCRRSVTVVLPPHQQEQQRAISPSASLQAGMTEEQALQRALEMSLAESARSTQQPLSPQEEEDLALAQALAASEEEFSRQQQQQRPQNREPKQSSCSVS